jgi:ribosomal protein S18 acetylase RimI-like enzyme
VHRVFLALEYPPEIADTKADQAVARYRSDPDWRLFGAEANSELIAIVGWSEGADQEIEIHHIAVLAEFRKRSVGSELIRRVWEQFSPAVLMAETDRGAVGFYRSLGFRVESLGEKYPGVERFLCTLSRKHAASISDTWSRFQGSDSANVASDP